MDLALTKYWVGTLHAEGSLPAPSHTAVNKKDSWEPCQILGMLKVPLEHRNQVIPPGAHGHGFTGLQRWEGETRQEERNRIFKIIRVRCVQAWEADYAHAFPPFIYPVSASHHP